MEPAHHGDQPIGRQRPAPGFRNARVEVDREAARVTVAGEVDMAEADALRDLLVGAARGAAALEVDLREVRFIDSAGCRALVRAVREAGDGGCAVRCVVGDGAVRRVFRLLGIERLLCREEPSG